MHVNINNCMLFYIKINKVFFFYQCMISINKKKLFLQNIFFHLS